MLTTHDEFRLTSTIGCRSRVSSPISIPTPNPDSEIALLRLRNSRPNGLRERAVPVEMKMFVFVRQAQERCR